jgi:hypothetical protein
MESSRRSARAATQFEAHLDDAHPQHLLRGHSLSARRFLGPAVFRSAEIAPNEVSQLRIGVQDSVDFLPLLLGARTGMLKGEGSLRIANQAHLGLFCVAVVCVFIVLFI